MSDGSPQRFPAPVASRDLSRNLRNYQLIGHSPDTPWWATPLGISIVVAIFLGLVLLVAFF